MAAAVGEWVVPGMRLGSASDYEPGQGSYVRGAHLYASVVGVAEQRPGSARPSLHVVAPRPAPVHPAIGSRATARVTRITARHAAAEILCVGGAPVREAFSGIIRAQDVRAADIDSVCVGACFRPGDVVEAEVISLGDARSLYLSTAREELGVVYARSAAGAPMTAAGTDRMLCPLTRSYEQRKVAKAPEAQQEAQAQAQAQAPQ
eukprot:m51a1_g9192 hypothetical protein (205) ;mRNA; f:83122-83736